MTRELTLLARRVADDLLADGRAGKIEKIDIDVIRERLRGLEAWNGIEEFDREAMEMLVCRRVVDGSIR